MSTPVFPYPNVPDAPDINLPVTPLIPRLTQYPVPSQPFNNITPFTYKAGNTFAELFYGLRDYFDSEVIPNVNDEVARLINGWQATAKALVDAVNDGNNELVDALNEALGNQQQALTAALEEEQEWVQTNISQTLAYVNNAVEQVLASSITLQAPVMKSLVETPGIVQTALDTRYVQPSFVYSRSVIDDLASEAQRIRSRGQLPVHFIEKIIAWPRLLVNKVNPVVTIVGDSITEGVGANDTSDGISYDDFRNYAYSVIVNRLFGRMRNVRPAPGFIGALPSFGFSSVRSGTPVVGPSFGPFGNYGTDNSGTGGLDRRRGGYGLAGASNQEWSNVESETGFFNNFLVCSFGLDSGISSPRTYGVTIDGLEFRPKPTGNVNQTGNMVYEPFTGIGNRRHTVNIKGGGVSANTPFYGIVAYNDNQVIVNRMGAAGATSADFVGAGLTGSDKQRVKDATILKGLTDLLIICVGYNDGNTLTDSVKRAAMKANIQEMMTNHLGSSSSNTCLLISPPPGANAVDTQVYYELASENERSAYMPLHKLFGPRSLAVADGLFPTSGTVHPSRYGHRVMGNMLFNSLPEPFIN